MSDPITILAGLQYNEGDIIRQTIANTYIVDYGIVKTVNADKTVDVTHAVMGKYINGDPVGQTVSRSVEVVFLGSASFAQTWPIAVGDGVILLGLKNFVPTTKGIQPPTAPPSNFPHYTRDTLKAIPLQNVSSPMISMEVDNLGNAILQNNNIGGLWKISNATQSLFIILNSVLASIATGGTANSTGNIAMKTAMTAFATAFTAIGGAVPAISAQMATAASAANTAATAMDTNSSASGAAAAAATAAAANLALLLEP